LDRHALSCIKAERGLAVRHFDRSVLISISLLISVLHHQGNGAAVFVAWRYAA
jgi:hypothetical protein